MGTTKTRLCRYGVIFGDGDWWQADAWISPLAGAVEVKALAQGALRRFTQWLWVEYTSFKLRGGHFTTELSLPYGLVYAHSLTPPSLSPLVVRRSMMTLLNAFPCIGAYGYLARRLRRKLSHILYKRIHAALLEWWVELLVSAHAFLLPHQYIAVRMLSAPCRKLHAIRLSPCPIPHVWRKWSRIA